ncbi:MAG: FtsW/RodA/SpoVE family cell cycle protein [Bacilli bacterium]
MKKDTIFNHIDKPLLLLLLITTLYGLIMLFSANSITSLISTQNIYSEFLKQFVYLLLAFILYFILAKLPTRIYKKCIPILIWLSFFSLILVYFFPSTRGVHSWIKFGPISLQPSEFSKIIFIVYMGVFYGQNIKKKALKYTWFIPLIIGVIFWLLIFMQKDLGTSIVLAGIVYFTFISLPLQIRIQNYYTKKISPKINFRITSIFKTLGLLGIVFLFGLLISGGLNIILTKTQIERIKFDDVCTKEKYYTTGMQLCNSFIAFNNGGLTGLGIGNSKQKLLYLPEPDNDFIFAIVVEETGALGGMIVLILVLSIIYRCLVISKNSTTLQNSIISLGVGVFLLMHVLINVGGVSGAIPMTGLPFPFFSSGGSFLWTIFISMGIVSRISIENSLNQKKIRRTVKL